MNENIFTEELSKEINKLRNDAVLKCISNYYSLNVYCGFTLLRLACKARRVGEEIFNKEFISKYEADIKNNNTDKLTEIVNSKIVAAEARYFLVNEQDINSLPKVHKNNKKVLSSFIRDCICSGFKIKCEIILRLMTAKV